MSIIYDDNWSLTRKQELSIIESDARINIWYGGVRAGKTIASIIRWLDYLARNPEGKKAMIGKTHRTLRRNVLSPIKELVGRDNYYENKGEGVVKIAGQEIDIYGANDDRSVEKIAGATLAGTYCDEVSLWSEDMFKMTTGRNSVPGAKLFLTTNPANPEHWLKKNYIDMQEEMNIKAFHFELEDNKSLERSYIEDLKKEYHGVWYQRYIKGLWVLAEGLVYDMYDRDVHIVDKLPEMKEYWVGIDYGTSNATAFILVGLGQDNNIYVIDEYKHSGGDLQSSKTDSDYTDDLIDWLNKNKVQPQWILIDPSAKSFRTQVWNSRNRHRAFNSVRKGNNKVLDGIRTVSSLFSSNKLYVYRPNCNEVIKELGLYSWDKSAQELGQDRPAKKHDHLMDALRYAIMGIDNSILNKLLIERR